MCVTISYNFVKIWLHVLQLVTFYYIFKDPIVCYTLLHFVICVTMCYLLLHFVKMRLCVLHYNLRCVTISSQLHRRRINCSFPCLPRCRPCLPHLKWTHFPSNTIATILKCENKMWIFSRRYSIFILTNQLGPVMPRPKAHFKIFALQLSIPFCSERWKCETRKSFSWNKLPVLYSNKKSFKC